jgi:transcriptional regulator with GAF, ATPase, and Fis domain
MGQHDTSSVLTAVARLVAEAPSLREVVARLTASLRPAIAFDRLHVLRLDRAESFALYDVDPTGAVKVTEHRISDASGPPEVDGALSRLVCTVRQGTRVHGALWLTSMHAEAFTDDDQALMDSVTDLLGLAFEHDAIVERESLRRERIDSLRGLLHTMAGALDVRHVFGQVSDVVRGGMPHDILAITSWEQEGAAFRVYAIAGVEIDDASFFAPMAVTGSDRAQLNRGAYVVHDSDAEVEQDSIRAQLFRRLGVRSALRVPMPLGSNVFGSVFFLSRDLDRFSEEDIDFGRRVADHLALAISHQQLAEVARRDAESRETAARLEAQVATLTRELEARTGHRRVVGRSRQWKDVLAQAARVAKTETTVLLTGESGTGKELLAAHVHRESPFAAGPFVKVNCAAIPNDLIESELFGHEKCAFTGAAALRRGKFELAYGGTIFLH